MKWPSMGSWKHHNRDTTQWLWKSLCYFSTEESQLKGLQTSVTRDPESPELITEGQRTGEQPLLIRAAKIKQRKSRITEFPWGGKRGCCEARVQVASRKWFWPEIEGVPETQKEILKKIYFSSNQQNNRTWFLLTLSLPSLPQSPSLTYTKLKAFEFSSLLLCHFLETNATPHFLHCQIVPSM